MATDFDLIVIGAGPGGYVAAIRAAQHGLKVACIEKRGTLGGTCLNVGCIPSKALLHGSHFFEEAGSGHLAKFGVKIAGVELDLAALLAEKDKAVKELTDGVAFLFKKNKVEWIKGEARFVDAKSITVGDRTLTAKDFIIATGSEPTSLPGVTPDGEVIVTSTEALTLGAVPGHLVVIGGGYIGLEMGSVWRRLGSKVTVVEYAPRIVPAMDVEVGNAFAKVLKKQGMVIHTDTKVTGVARKGTGAVVTVEPVAGGAATEIEADVVLLSTGRRPNTDGLNIEATGLVLEQGRVPINHDFSTSVAGIWAIGDVVEGPMLAHKAEDEGVAAADNIAGLNGHVNRDVIPAVVYTDPEVATVGRTEEELKAAGIQYKVGKFPFAANSRAKTNRDTEGFVKVLADAVSDRILGVHIIGPMAGTMIAEAALAMEFGASSEDLALTCHAHPTHPEALKEAAMAVTGKPIHM
ncbi:dihydrolipoamide dehydrogenase [Polymorphobacter multimanifer]|uniref:Dihydrolipoyl dehydrogenase n=1 Tax=Polymorphobacter multimanifer TaxID=1070431 RepID=A0A841LII2_9SPHN|nr:dihydrolipoyl dehydrogenase [Polymorphobacter multimanifer]MBB6228778.1 dihydrolipoamide dehydrogenase [Polymorphobacter multimanifer]